LPHISGSLPSLFVTCMVAFAPGDEDRLFEKVKAALSKN
jgi:hypothetical protein